MPPPRRTGTPEAFRRRLPNLTLSNKNPQPSPCFALLQLTTKAIVYDKKLTDPTQSIWNCNPKNVVQLTAAQQAKLNSL